MILCITNQCNRDCDYCFEGAFKHGPAQEMSLHDVQRVTDFGRLAQARDAGVSIMGGEPTLHPQLVEIVDYIRLLNPSAGIQLLSNLLCDEALLHELTPRRVGCLVNVSSYPDYSEEERRLLHANLKYAREQEVFHFVMLAVTIVDEDQDFGFLYDMLAQDQPRSINAIRIGISCPGKGFANRFPREFSLGFGEKYCEIVQRCHEIRPLIVFLNECSVNMCMMALDTYNELVRVVKGLHRHCQGNLDILPDLSTHWCFAFEDVPELRIPNLFEYRDMVDVHKTLCARVGRLERELDTQCDSRGCRSLECVGPCIAMKYYRKHLST